MSKTKSFITRKAAVMVVGGAIAATVLLAGPGLRGTPVAQAQEMSQEEFETRVRDYLMAHPEVILEAVQGLQARQEQDAAQAAQAAIGDRADDLLHDPDSPVAGNPDGDVTLVEFFDYNCPYCRQVAPVMAEAMAADPELRVVYKEFPILGEGSDFAARAALAADRQGRYLAFHEAMMAHQGTVDRNVTLVLAEDVGLDLERLEADMADPAIRAAINRTYELAGALQINGTPGFVVGDTIIPGAVDLATLQAAIGQAREAQ
ncbi:MAG: DsbA family protein [Alphaproteobacteria bacterium]